MTPCEEKGYKVGDEFVVSNPRASKVHRKGVKVRLCEDDGSSAPYFEAVFKKDRDGIPRWVFDLGEVSPFSAHKIITRTNGQPFSTEASARQQLAAKGLQGTHEVVPHEGGYALVAKLKHDEPITLRAGDYVRIKDIGSAGQAKAIADAFIAAGALTGAGYPYEKNKEGWDNLFWDGSDNMTNRGTGGLRRLMPHQVLNSTNAGTTTPQTEQPTMLTDPITTLKQARQARDEAEQAYQEALEEAREYLGQGFELIEVGIDAASADQLRKAVAAATQIPERMLFGDVEEDMTDPANWREGDVFEVMYDNAECADVKKGDVVVLEKTGNDVFVCKETGYRWHLIPDCVKFHHRPA